MSVPRQIAVVSGKGGTGKTVVTASLVQLAAPVVAVDCDVDASNLALLLDGEDGPAVDFFSGQRAILDEEACIGCGICAEHCRFGAVTTDADGRPTIDLLSCEGCGVCAMTCPTQSIEMEPNLAGSWCSREIAAGALVHARLGIAQDNSGKLVARVREEGRVIAEQRGLPTMLLDGPPGVGCPVHATITGVDYLLCVTEPTPAGEHDLRRLLELARHFDCRAGVVINKRDLAPEQAERLTVATEELGFPVLGSLPFCPELPRLVARGELALSLQRMATPLERIWERLRAEVDDDDRRAQAAEGG